MQTAPCGYLVVFVFVAIIIDVIYLLWLLLLLLNNNLLIATKRRDRLQYQSCRNLEWVRDVFHRDAMAQDLHTSR